MKSSIANTSGSSTKDLDTSIKGQKVNSMSAEGIKTEVRPQNYLKNYKFAPKRIWKPLPEK
jgi:hypothetical protein